jgi:PAS domain S-box-containing protein
LAEDIARAAAVALDNARLYSEVYQERERLQVTLSSIGDAVIATDEIGTVTFINPVAEALTGWQKADAIGMPLSKVFHIVNATSREEVESPVVKVLRDGVISGLANHTILIVKDGTEVPIDDSAAPINNAAGTLVGVILVFRDIRERYEAEAKIRAALDRLSDLYATSRQIGVASTPDNILTALLTSQQLQPTSQAAILIFDQNWQQNQSANFEIVARRRKTPLWGLAATHSVKDSPLMAVVSSDESLFIEDVNTDTRLDDATRGLLKQYDIANVLIFPLWAGNRCFGMLLLYYPTPHRLTQSNFQYIQVFADQVALVLDNIRLFDAEKQARQAAELANEIKLKFLAMISHELRTPLTSIKGFATSLLATDISWDETTQREFLTIITQESDKLTDLIGQLLDLSQLQAGILRIHPTEVSLKHIVNIATAPLSVLTQSHELNIDIPATLPHVFADPQRIAEVLTNLVGNAVKYAPEETMITISASVQDDTVRVNVGDEGPGIKPENRAIVFEAFQQLERRSLPNGKGAGLGLAICKGLVEAHHGRIWISDDQETGTLISFTLPTTDVFKNQPSIIIQPVDHEPADSS